MKKAVFIFKLLLLSLSISIFVLAQEGENIKLLKPTLKGGKPFMEVLKERKSSRSYSSKMLTDQMLSDLLWAAFGANRLSGKRTAPSYNDAQEIDIYVILEKGLYIYNAKKHRLDFIHGRDLRTAAGVQEYVQMAPVNLIYVADYTKQNLDREIFYADTGYISQNVYLFCASAGLSTAVRAAVNREKLSEEMGLRNDQKITLGQAVGYPN